MNAAVALSLLLVLDVSAEPLPRGTHQFKVELDETALELFTYKPDSYRDGPLILVFHGVSRNAKEYRDHARAMGDRFGALIVSPLFPEDRFPIESYQLGGLKVDGKAQPRDKWTWRFVPLLAAEIRRREGRAEMPYYLIGHSGGGQFLIRLAAFVDPGAERIVASNPGTYIFPTREAAYPFGFGELPAELSNDEALRRYLAQPITLYLGAEDKERDEHFNQSEEAMRQGGTRWERGQAAYRAAKELADTHGWPFHWRLVAVEGVGHDHTAMFDNALCREALFGAQQKKEE